MSSSPSPLSPSPPVGLARRLFPPLCITLVSFAALFPTLNWLEFHNSIENIVVTTALETRREGHWLLPRMLGETRTRKPPVAAWASALAIRPATVTALDDPARRDAAYRRLATEVRWPALLATCITLAAVYELGRVVGGSGVGWCAAAAAGANLLVFNSGQLATPDTHLTLWAAVTNVFLARAILRGQRWLGCVGGGAALGMAMMSKGPVCLIETIAPALLMLMWWRGTSPSSPSPGTPGEGREGAKGSESIVIAPSPALPRSSGRGGRWRDWAWPMILGVVTLLAISLPWYALLLARAPGVLTIWRNEITRIDPADPRPDPWFNSLRFFMLFMPWTPWLIVGLVGSAVSAIRRERRSVELACWLFVVPFVVFSCFKERKPRYVQPLVVPAAVLAGWAMVEQFRHWAADRFKPARDWPIVAHWLCLAGVVLGLPIVGMYWHADSGRWYGTATVAVALAVGAVALAAGLYVGGKNAVATALAAALPMLAWQALFRYGYSRDESGRADMKPLADAIFAQVGTGEVQYIDPAGQNAPLDLSIYLNRVVRTSPSMETALSNPPAVIVVAQRQANAPPAPPGPDWRELAATPRGRVVWHAFAASSSSSQR